MVSFLEVGLIVLVPRYQRLNGRAKKERHVDPDALVIAYTFVWRQPDSKDKKRCRVFPDTFVMKYVIVFRLFSNTFRKGCQDPE